MNPDHADEPIVHFAVLDGVNPKAPYFRHISGLWKFEKQHNSKFENTRNRIGEASTVKS